VEPVGARLKTQPEDIVADQQGGGLDVVGAQGLLVEGPRIPGLDGVQAVVQEHVAPDMVDAPAAHLPQQQPETLQGQTRVAAAAQVQVAVQRPVADLAPDQDRGLPGVIGPQSIQ